MLTLVLPTEKERFVSSIQNIAFTPPGVSTNQVLDAVIPDIKNGTVGVYAC